MTLSVPPRSLPPPVLPPKLAAETRIKALRADLEPLTKPSQRAALQHEIAALIETRLADRDGALAAYEDAARTDPGFRPPLFALARLLREAGDFPRLARVLEALVHASRSANDVASALVELGIVLADELEDPSSAHARFLEAVEASAASPVAGLMLERHERIAGDVEAAQAALATRMAHTNDHELEAALRREVAEETLLRGEVDQAIEILLTATTLPVQRYAMLERAASIARAHGRHVIAAQAYDDMATLLQSRLAAEQASRSDALIAHFPDAAACSVTIAALRRESGRLHLTFARDIESARHAYDSAEEHQPSDVLITLEHMLACERAEDFESARADAQTLLPRADPQRAAALSFHLAELAEQQGDRAEARARLRASLITDPTAPAVLAALEDALVDERSFGELCDHLEARAKYVSADERRGLLTRAAAVAAGPGRDPERAMRLYGVLLEGSSEKTSLLRELYGTALRAADAQMILESSAQLLVQNVDESEISALMRQRYATWLTVRETERAQQALLEALEHPACAKWAAHGATVMGALRRDHALLARGHALLAEQAFDVDLASAHLCAQGRALSRLDKLAEATRVLQRALELSPGNAYAVALLEELLHRQGDATQAVHLLREAAASAQTARRGELSLLHAGAAAESAGRIDLAARSYAEAAEREPDAIAPLWALRRAAERASDSELELSAIEGLALREARLGEASFFNTELGERFDLRDKPELAAGPLRAAFAGPAAFEAHVSAWLLSHTDLDHTLQADALRWLQTHVAEDTRAWLERERIAGLAHGSKGEASLALAALKSERGSSASDELLGFFLASTPSERADALSGFGALCDDPSARAELSLHASRVLGFSGVGTSTDALVTALASMEEAPEALASAVALGESLSPSDDAEMRVRALQVRLAHTLPEAAQSLSTALARALLDAGRATEASELLKKLVHKDDSDSSAWEALRVAAREVGDLRLVVRACDTLAARAEGESRALLLEEAAALLEEELVQPAEAEVRLRAALKADDTRITVFERLHDLLLARHDFDSLSSLVSARVRVAASEEERSDLLYEQARLSRGLGERDAALACIDEVLGIEPTHAGALGLLAEIHASAQSWPAAIEALRALARADAPASQRQLARKGAADFFERHLHDVRSAYEELAILEREGLADLATYRRMAELAQRAQLLPQAISALAHAAKQSQGEARASLERRAGELLARDPSRKEEARQAFSRALAAQPTDIDACEASFALSSAPEQSTLLQTFTSAVLAGLAKDPEQTAGLRALRRVARLATDTTLEHVTLGALRALGVASSEELARHAVLDASMITTPTESWTQEHFDALGDSSVPAAAMRFASIACKAWLDVNDDQPSKHGVARADRVGRRGEHALRAALTAWAQSFGLTVSELYAGGSGAHAIAMVMQPGHAQAWIAGKNVEAPLGKYARFHVAQQCAATCLGVLPLVRTDKLTGRDILFATWLALQPTAAVAGTITDSVRQLAVRIAKALSRAQRRELEQCLAELADPQAALDAALDSVRTLGLRAGLVASADLNVALESVLGARFDASQISSSAAALGLLRFWTSNTLLSLRRELGLVA